MSKVRKQYIFRLIGRCIIWLICAGLYFYSPQEFDILEGMNFFAKPSILHILWGLWVLDMALQVFPIKSSISLGSQKLFANRFKPLREKIDKKALHNYIVSTTKAAYKVFILWCLLIAAMAAVYWLGILGKKEMFMITVCFYIFDLICVLIWCPFRLLMRTRCCTTCRIFNWDHFMMFSPIIFLGGFYSLSLVLMSVAVWIVWELCVLLYPERFWEKTNVALKCSECTDKLCTQYCQKLRK